MSRFNLKSNLSPLIILTIFFVANFFILDLALAVEVPKEMTLNIPLGSLINVKVGGNALGVYVQAWFQFLLGVIGIIATVMIMIGGFKYLTSQGDKGKIQDAQNMMVSAITGLILAFGSVAILGLVNPKLLTLKVITLEEIDYSGTYDNSRRENDGTTAVHANTSEISNSGSRDELTGTAQFVDRSDVLLDQLAAEGKLPEGFRVTDGYRDCSGGNSTSQHCAGNAFDATWPGITRDSALALAAEIERIDPSLSTIVERDGDPRWGSSWPTNGWGIHIDARAGTPFHDSSSEK